MFKKNHLLLLSLAFGLQLTIVGCSKEENELNVVELAIDKSKVALIPDKSTTVNITTGNGEYAAVSSNDNVAKATISGNVVTVTATTKEERAHAVIVITDKMFKRTSIDVEIAKIFDLVLSTTQASLEVGVPNKSEIVVLINKGNFGYKTELLENAGQFIEIDNSKLEASGKFTVKAKAAGTARVKVTDAQGKEVVVNLTVTAPNDLIIDKTAVSITSIQGTEVITVSSGNGDYKTTVANPLIAKAYSNGSQITVKGKIKGSTTLTIEDKKGQKKTINVTIDGPGFAMNLSDQYFGYANFTDIAIVDQSVKTNKQVTFELTCKMSGYRGLQTFMGLEGNLIIRGKNDDYRETHPIQISGLGDRVMLESTKSFNLNEWLNIAFVVDCNQADIKEKYKLYINGVQDVLIVNKQEQTHSVVDLASGGDGNRFQVGRAAGQDFRAMKGIVSEARVWTVARTAQQIKDGMCGLTGTNHTGLLARWDFSAGVETGYIQDSNGGKYETNLILANAKLGGNYTQTKVPQNTFVAKGCPN